jgi:hypothetical protein
VSYLTPRSSEPLSFDLLFALAEAVKLSLPAEDLAPVAASLADQLAAMDVLDQLDLGDINPCLEFDPRWHD